MLPVYHRFTVLCANLLTHHYIKLIYMIVNNHFADNSLLFSKIFTLFEMQSYASCWDPFKICASCKDDTCNTQPVIKGNCGYRQRQHARSLGYRKTPGAVNNKHKKLIIVSYLDQSNQKGRLRSKYSLQAFI